MLSVCLLPLKPIGDNSWKIGKVPSSSLVFIVVLSNLALSLELSPKQVDDDIDVHESHMTVRFYRVAGVPIVPYVHLEDVKTE